MVCVFIKKPQYSWDNNKSADTSLTIYHSQKKSLQEWW